MPQISIILSLLHRDLSRQKRAATLEALSDPPLEKWFPADEGKRGVIFSFISSERGSEPKRAFSPLWTLHSLLPPSLSVGEVVRLAPTLQLCLAIVTC